MFEWVGVTGGELAFVGVIFGLVWGASVIPKAVVAMLEGRAGERR
jgi:hypothetical protein